MSWFILPHVNNDHFGVW